MEKEEEIQRIAKLKVIELKNYLRIRGQSVTGKRTELVTRAIGCIKLGIGPRLGAEIAPCATGVLSERLERLLTPCGKQLPDPLNLTTGWTSVTECPDIGEKDIYNYMVLSRHRCEDNLPMGAIRQTKGYTMFQERHVHSAFFNPVESEVNHGYGFIKAKVMPSLPSRDVKATPDYDAWVCLSKITGHVHSAFCTYTAGDGGSCNHIAAVLFMAADLSDRRQQGLLACTSQANEWLKPRKRILSPKKVTERPIRQKTGSKEPSNCIVVNFNSLREKLQKCLPDCSYVNITCDPSQQQPYLDVKIPAPAFSFADWVNLKHQESYLEMYTKSLKLSSEKTESLEQATRGQRKCSIWHEARAGRLTSSNFGAVMTRQPTTPPDNLVKVIMGYFQLRAVPSTKWGIDHEPAARRAYFNKMKKDHPLLTIADCGLLVDEDFAFLAASPDGLVTCGHCLPSFGLVEVKCPFTWRNSNVIEACASSDFCCTILDGKVQLKQNHPYFYQIQGQMAVAKRKWCDFVIWTMKDIHVQRIFFQEELWQSMLSKLTAFFVKGVAAEIHSSRVKRGKPLY